MHLDLLDGLRFAEVTLVRGGSTISLPRVLIDTGSGGTLFHVEHAEQIGPGIERTDEVLRVHGVGGSEFVVQKRLDQLVLGDVTVHDIEIEVGAMDNGIPLDGIIGMNVPLAWEP